MAGSAKNIGKKAASTVNKKSKKILEKEAIKSKFKSKMKVVLDQSEYASAKNKQPIEINPAKKMEWPEEMDKL